MKSRLYRESRHDREDLYNQCKLDLRKLVAGVTLRLLVFHLAGDP